jgi:energy-coupling factor transporter transmembrane protein EcfT
MSTELARRRAAPVLLGALVGALIAGRAGAALLCLGVGVAAAGAARAPWPRAAWWRVLAIGGLVSVALNAYLLPGAALGGPAILGHLPSREGAWQGLLLALRIAGAAVALHGLGAAWPGERAADEIAARLRPLERLRVPVRRSRAVLGLALRFAPLLRDEYRRVAAIQRLRAGGAPRGLGDRLARMRSVVIPGLVGSLERADQVALALEARHYRLREPEPTPSAGWAWQGAGWALVGAGLLWR